MTTITITGPGGIINYEAEVIRKALEDAGCTVTYENDCAEDDPQSFNAEIHKRLTDPN